RKTVENTHCPRVYFSCWRRDCFRSFRPDPGSSDIHSHQNTSGNLAQAEYDRTSKRQEWINSKERAGLSLARLLDLSRLLRSSSVFLALLHEAILCGTSQLLFGSLGCTIISSKSGICGKQSNEGSDNQFIRVVSPSK
ncbi:MAG: hypothetical protein WA635_02955, partial [Gallionella sp.]